MSDDDPTPEPEPRALAPRKRVVAREVTDVFDFEGSMIESLERLFRAFGGRQTPYLRVTRATRRGQAALAMRSGWRRVSTGLPR